MGVQDMVSTGEAVGCENLLRAVKRCRPRLHCFGHIHEGWGAQRINWAEGIMKELLVESQKVLNDRCVHLDISKSSEQPLLFGDETLFVNAAIMDVHNEPVHAPWLVDLDLPVLTTE